MKVWKCRMCGHYFYSEKAHGVLAEHMFAAHNEIPFVVEAGFEEQDWGSGGLYINFEFSEMTWTEDCYVGRFVAADYGVSCHFRYGRGSGDYELWDVAAPDGRLLPLPIFWLDQWLEEKGNLDGVVARVCF